jgi:hypothetical protein
VRLLDNAKNEMQGIINGAKQLDPAAAGGKINEADIQRIRQIVLEVDKLKTSVAQDKKALIQQSVNLIDTTMMHMTQAMMGDLTQARADWTQLKSLHANNKLKSSVNQLTMFRALMNSIITRHPQAH